jgi:GNAT superfamily N-acetyltransferase
MSTKQAIQIGLLKKAEIADAVRIIRLAFGTFLGMPNPLDFMGDRDFLTPRWCSSHVKVIAARDSGRLIATNVVTQWGSFGFFGPLTVLPEYWDRGVAQRLLEATMKAFDKWGVSHSGLYTFPASAKHIALYQKFGYWPRYLTAIMTRTPQAKPTAPPTMLSAFSKARREDAIRECSKLTSKIDKGLDLTGELRAVLLQCTGDVVLTYTRDSLDAFAVCLTGAGSEGGRETCYIKFGAARTGSAAGERFGKLLDACDSFASARGISIEAGVNLAREDAYRRMRNHGYRPAMHGLAMQRPHNEGFNRAGAYVIDDWR